MSTEGLSGAGTRLAHRFVRRLVLRARARQGYSRVRASFWPLVQAAAAASISYLLAGWLLGHAQPFFAAIAAWACLGFSFERDLRKIAEVALGVTVGVGVGDLVVRAIGSGWWQLSTVLVVAAILARFIDRGAVLAAQAGTQAIVVVGLPSLTGGPLGRAGDALIGGAVALALALLTPGDPRRGLRTLGNVATSALAAVVEMAAAGVRAGDVERLEATLVRARAADPALLEWLDRVHSATDRARVSVNRVHRAELERLESQAVLVERAMRSVRVLARRAPIGIAHATASDRAAVADLLDRYAAGARQLASAVETGHDATAARGTLAEVAHDADPRTAADDWGAQSLVLLLRSPIVDLLEATGVTPAAARALLTEL
ncbi:membrane protein-like protein [Xylanimonas cellulosilytica DSM 15894]|uniref:Membrane protein-like protein n=1 Tax=Xylanimonas cellulosilytica (strain DSM 15894 / JCM 12276 / CECT 5975 / KCTC 9989 / LMG 20990 / NBRC 107835 / XIL07) TaxID=446471 RepID=D1BZQ5_XYLCX|nr:FUSC family protein [Xylanimonas cellulosilytica]ACZ32033.1 membrane protein-like protein [Xylanimonas cellulosilytica DSM 15894]